jgi:6,7-dimethyl-8-ribityllumazine synthase
MRLAIVVSEFNSEVTFRMLENAKKHMARIGAKASYIFYVPGVYDMPLAVERLLKKRTVDAVITIGAVIKGDTRHDDIVAENAARLLADLSLKHGKPVALGITGPGMTDEQAEARAEEVPVRAVNAAANMVLRLGKLEKTVGRGTVMIDDTADNN